MEPTPQIPTLRLADDAAMPALGLGTWKSAPGEVGAAVVARDIQRRPAVRAFDGARDLRRQGDGLLAAVRSRQCAVELHRTQTRKLFSSISFPLDAALALAEGSIASNLLLLLPLPLVMLDGIAQQKQAKRER